MPDKIPKSKLIASSRNPEALGGLLKAIGTRFNCTSHLGIKSRDEPEAGRLSGWVLDIDNAALYTGSVIYYLRGWLDGRGAEAADIWTPSDNEKW